MHDAETYDAQDIKKPAPSDAVQVFLPVFLLSEGNACQNISIDNCVEKNGHHDSGDNVEHGMLF